MTPSFTLKALSPARPSLPLSIPSNNPTPLSSPGRSPINASSGYFPTSPLLRRRADQSSISRSDALKVVRHLEDVVTAWNEYRIALATAGKAGKRLAGAMKDLAGCMNDMDVSAQTIKPSAAMIESTSDLLSKLSKRVDASYDYANADATKYFNLLAKESRSHDAYLSAVSKKHDKAEKAYRKASKSLGDTAGAHSGLIALKTSLSDDIARANAAMLLGSKQAGVLVRMASAIGALAGNITSYFSEGLRKAGAAYPDVEYFRALADVQWQGEAPNDLEEEVEVKKRDEIRLIKSRIALGEMDVVGEKAWNALSAGPPTPQSAPRPAPVPGPTNDPRPAEKPALLKTVALEGSIDFPALQKRVEEGKEPNAAPKDALVRTLPAQAFAFSEAEEPLLIKQSVRSSPATHRGDKTTPSSATANISESSIILSPSRSGEDMSSRRQPLPRVPVQSSDSMINAPMHSIIRSLPQSPGENKAGPRPPAGPRRISIPGHAPRWSVSQIARDMDRHAIADRQNTFEAHQGHRSFVSGCSLCSMDYDRMSQMRQQQASRRVTMPPAYTPPQPEEYQAPQYLRRPTETSWGREEFRRSSYYGSGIDSNSQGLQAPTPRTATGADPEFGLGQRMP